MTLQGFPTRLSPLEKSNFTRFKQLPSSYRPLHPSSSRRWLFLSLVLGALLWVGLHWTNYSPLAASNHQGFTYQHPKRIWQTANEAMVKEWADKSATWKELNPLWTYTMISDAMQDQFVDTHLSSYPSLRMFWHSLTSPILRADLIRYFSLFAVGGVYSDMDTSCLKSIDEWIPPEFQPNAVVGVEYDDTTYKMFVRRISFCQWTLMSKPKHPIFEAVIRNAIAHLEYLARVKRTTPDQLKLDKGEVLEATGPGAFSDAVLRVIQDQLGVEANITFESFSGLKRPTMFGDVLILPINGFGFGQKHSHSSDPAYGEALARHHFGRSWYKKPPDTAVKNVPQAQVAVENKAQT